MDENYRWIKFLKESLNPHINPELNRSHPISISIRPKMLIIFFPFVLSKTTSFFASILIFFLPCLRSFCELNSHSVLLHRLDLRWLFLNISLYFFHVYNKSTDLSSLLIYSTHYFSTKKLNFFNFDILFFSS